jgi:hypothetical protein
MTEAEGDDTVRVQYIGKWSRQLESDQTDFHINGHTSQPSTSRMDVNAAQVDELTLGKTDETTI